MMVRVALIGTCLLLAACGGDPSITVRDRAGDVAEPSVIEMYRGHEHCDWDQVTFLHLGWPVGETIGQDARMYVRDPDGELADQTVSHYDEEGELPIDGRTTGFTSEAGELWFSEADQDSVAYLVGGEGEDVVEVWPRTRSILGCD